MIITQINTVTTLDQKEYFKIQKKTSASFCLSSSIFSLSFMNFFKNLNEDFVLTQLIAIYFTEISAAAERSVKNFNLNSVQNHKMSVRWYRLSVKLRSSEKKLPTLLNYSDTQNLTFEISVQYNRSRCLFSKCEIIIILRNSIFVLSVNFYFGQHKFHKVFFRYSSSNFNKSRDI